ncbi:MAG: DNA replication/repair protein RecF [Acidimicrobiales bacterium]
MRRRGRRVPVPADAGEGVLTALAPAPAPATTTVSRLEVENFRNLESVCLLPAENGLTVIQGDNGAGKTSLLESLVYCSLLRSFRGVPKDALIRTGCEQAAVRCELRHDNRRIDIAVGVVLGRRDRVERNGQRVEGSRELLEVLRTTLFTPDDLELAKGSPSLRRDLLDDVIAATRPRLGAERANLDRILRQRNALLRQLGGRLNDSAAATLAVWDERLAETGERVATARAELTEQLEPLAREAFAALAPGASTLEIRYARSYDGPLEVALAAARDDDLRRQVTTVGPQRDDLDIFAGGLDARTRLSQGRQRCVALSLRLATHRHITGVTGVTPVLLLDDAFSELDEHTARALVSELPSAQALLTTAGPLPPGASPDLVVRLADGKLA